LTHFVFQNQQLLVAGANDGDYRVASFFEGFGDGVCCGCADASTDHGDFAVVLDFTGFSEGSCDGEDFGADFEFASLYGGEADFLENEGDGALVGVPCDEGEGDAFAVFVYAEDDELSGFGFLGYVGGGDGYLLDLGCELGFGEDFVGFGYYLGGLGLEFGHFGSLSTTIQYLHVYTIHTISL
jgi:hypothetical protein